MSKQDVKQLTPEQERLARETFLAALNNQEARFEVYGRGRQVKVREMEVKEARAA